MHRWDGLKGTVKIAHQGVTQLERLLKVNNITRMQFAKNYAAALEFLQVYKLRAIASLATVAC